MKKICVWMMLENLSFSFCSFQICWDDESGCWDGKLVLWSGVKHSFIHTKCLLICWETVDGLRQTK